MKRVGKGKKLFVGVLALAMTLSMGTTAFAEVKDPTPAPDVIIYKNYVVKNKGTIAPSTCFKLEQTEKVFEDDSIKPDDIPDLKIGSANFGPVGPKFDVLEGEFDVVLPKNQYKRVGVYTYTLKEVEGTTAGITYHTDEIKLVVTVINKEAGDGFDFITAVHTESSGKKSDTFKNTYSAGQLNVTKEVTGNMGDKDKYFEFKVVLTQPEGKEVKSTMTATVGGTEAEGFQPEFIKNDTDGTYTYKYEFQLKNDETFTINNLPYGVNYNVSEKDYEGYDTTITDDNTKAKVDAAQANVNAARADFTFTNEKQNDNPDTGINLDSLPYVLVFAGVAVIAAAALVVRRRRSGN